jgi:RecA-family ATPase
VLLLSHPSLSGLNSGNGSSGSTAWNNSVRSRLYLERVKEGDYEPNPDARRLSTKKANYSRTGGEITMTWCGGVFEADTPERGHDGVAPSVKAERVFLSLLKAITDQGRKVNHQGGQTYAPNIFASHPHSEGVTKGAFTAAMESLLTQGKIRVSEDGPASKRRTYLEVCA